MYCIHEASSKAVQQNVWKYFPKPKNSIAEDSNPQVLFEESATGKSKAIRAINNQVSNNIPTQNHLTSIDFYIHNSIF
jgi:hypothetical protein